MENNEIPMGLGMALAQNLTAMEKFAALKKKKNLPLEDEQNKYSGSLTVSDRD